MGPARQTDRHDLERRVHVDLPRVRPEEMSTAQEVEPARDPRGGRDTETEFMLRNGGFWP
ncbi:hypothetical protein [Phycicoccus sonneratiae]|uniref:Uncharacterized protein n=1 Tax=Phycicoccus sonneratiae TaxID=2807628 RepID=A0ABS2CKJ8_9MICO|nr:hypothetical protein [Phycicoccus sonneraticus]MBM6400415.1 hypothetical protein [Phycicoccus sonneraticus]